MYHSVPLRRAILHLLGKFKRNDESYTRGNRKQLKFLRSIDAVADGDDGIVDLFKLSKRMRNSRTLGHMQTQAARKLLQAEERKKKRNMLVPGHENDDDVEMLAAKNKICTRLRRAIERDHSNLRTREFVDRIPLQVCLASVQNYFEVVKLMKNKTIGMMFYNIPSRNTVENCAGYLRHHAKHVINKDFGVNVYILCIDVLNNLKADPRYEPYVNTEKEVVFNAINMIMLNRANVVVHYKDNDYKSREQLVAEGIEPNPGPYHMCVTDGFMNYAPHKVMHAVLDANPLNTIFMKLLNAEYIIINEDKLLMDEPGMMYYIKDRFFRGLGWVVRAGLEKMRTWPKISSLITIITTVWVGFKCYLWIRGPYKQVDCGKLFNGCFYISPYEDLGQSKLTPFHICRSHRILTSVTTQEYPLDVRVRFEFLGKKEKIKRVTKTGSESVSKIHFLEEHPWRDAGSLERLHEAHVGSVKVEQYDACICGRIHFRNRTYTYDCVPLAYLDEVCHLVCHSQDMSLLHSKYTFYAERLSKYSLRNAFLEPKTALAVERVLTIMQKDLNGQIRTSWD